MKTPETKTTITAHNNPDSNIRSFINQRKVYTQTFGQHTLHFGKTTHIMGIINITPDSFSHDGLLQNDAFADEALTKAKTLVQHGATIIDIGGESSRPGAAPVSTEEEIRRIIGPVQKIAAWGQVPVSVDTYKTDVAHAALDAGAVIINNIKGICPDEQLIHLLKQHNAGIVLMHIQGTPQTMQKQVQYQDVISEIYAELQNSVNFCLDHGLSQDKIIIDPGIGFGKTVEHNLKIIKHLQAFKRIDCPLLIGTSRKSFIGKILNQDIPEERLEGSLASAVTSITHGAHIIRAHDVKQTQRAAQITDAILNS